MDVHPADTARSAPIVRSGQSEGRAGLRLVKPVGVCTDGHRLGSQDIRGALSDSDAGVSKRRPQGRSRRIGSLVGGAGLGRDVGRAYAGDPGQSRETAGRFDACESSFPRDRHEPVLVDNFVPYGDPGVGCRGRLPSVLHGDNQYDVASDRSRSFARSRDEHLCIGPRFDARGCSHGGSQRPRDRRAGDRKLHGISGYSAGDSGRVAGSRGSRYRAWSGELTFVLRLSYDPSRVANDGAATDIRSRHSRLRNPRC